MPETPPPAANLGNYTTIVPAPGADGNSAFLPAEPGCALMAGQRFGDYELLAEVGRGGMGIVYKARQVSLNRQVALKTMPGALNQPEELRRFRTEAEATAHLQHANIVAIHEVGTIDGLHYYSMDYIEGPSLAQRLASGPLAGQVAAGYLRTIARAIQHAHQHGILHRDLKPSNILLDVNDQPHVTDFGLARRLGGDSGQTRTGAILGTPSYMAPEQAAGKNKQLDARCDVYGLGAILYELLTGRAPFRADTALDTVMQVLEHDPAPPRLLNPKVDRDLEMICLKCLEKEPQHRYPSAAALAEELERYLNGEPISTQSFNLLDRVARSLERSHYDVHFHSYGTMLLIFAAIVLAEHLLVFVLTRGDPPYPHPWLILSRILQFTAMGAVFWWYRRHRILPTSMAERQLWAIVFSYLLGCTFFAWVYHLLADPPPPMGELTLFPGWCILAGGAFFVMGSSYWGRCYVFSVAFFTAAVLIPFDLHFGPLAFGLLWSVALTLIGLHLHHLGDLNRGDKHP